MLVLKKSTKRALLKLNTTRAIARYKENLALVNPVSRDLVDEKLDWLTATLMETAHYRIFLNISFFVLDAQATFFLATLRQNNASYTFITQAELVSFLVRKESFLLDDKKDLLNGTFLIITAPDEVTYRRLLAVVLELELDSAKSALNKYQLIYTKEQKYGVAFSSLNTEIRNVYASHNTKNSILLETLTLLQFQTFTMVDVLNRPVDCICIAPADRLFHGFPFKS